MAKPDVNWDDDLLGRKENGIFLYKLVMQRYKSYHSAPGAPAMCFALDADWGAGKTFFVDRWSNDIAACEHPTIHFDAWANDLSDDPLVGFLVTLRNELKPWLKERPIAENLKIALGEKVENIIKQAGKAAIPAGVSILKGVVQRYAGNAFGEIADLWKEAEGSGNDSDAITPGQKEEAENKAEAQTHALVTKTVDKYLETVMKTHSDKQQAVASLKRNIEELVDFLVEKKVIAGPMFIFIDELDRCRPDYAIKLLEGIKHLFNARGVCFVVSTNLKQLSSAIKAVYGTEFDAYRYLKKFFSFEYMLPSPSTEEFGLSLIRNSGLVNTLERAGIPVILGLPQGNPDESGLATCFNIIATVMNLNLRSQRQVFEQAEAALAGCDQGKPLIILYHFFLAAVLHRGIATYDTLFNEQGISTGTIPSSLEMVHHALVTTRAVNYREQSRLIDLKTIVGQCHQYAATTLRLASEQVGNLDQNTYPANILFQIYNYGWKFEKAEYLSIAKAGKIIRASGYVK